MKTSMARVFFVLFLILTLGIQAVGQEYQWRAYNDCIRDPGDATAANVTEYSIYGGSIVPASGILKDFNTGQDTVVTAIFTQKPDAPMNTNENYGENPLPGTNAYEVFYDEVGANIIDFNGTIIQHHSTDVNWYVEIEFTGLDSTKKYSFVGTAFRNTVNTARVSLFTIRDADSFINNSDSGGPGWVGADTTKFLAPNNAVVGYVVRWDDIAPGSDGDFTIRAEADKSPGSHGRQGYPFHGFMLAEIVPPGNQPPEVEAGTDQEITMPINSLFLDATVTDDGLGDPNGFLALTWSGISGPGAVTFEPNPFVEDPTAVFQLHKYGDYILQLNATDGELDANDYITITVHEPICPVGDINGDCVVDGQDLYLLGLLWLMNPGAGADLDGDNFVNAEDYNLLAGNWMVNQQKGSLQVTIEPAEARNVGAQWRVDGGIWRDSGFIENDLAIDQHTVEFMTIFGWDTPASQQVQVEYGRMALASGTYIQQTGSLQVTITPPEAIAAGAQWQVDGGLWQNSGPPAAPNLSVGNHTVSFNSVSGWIKPGDLIVAVNKDLTTVEIGEYIELSDTTIVINEFMAVNSYIPFTNPNVNIYTTIYSGEPTHPDWIELHNLDQVNTVDLTGWYLTDNPEDLTKWQFPSKSLAPDGYLIVFASAKSQEEFPTNYPYVDQNGALHTNFELSSNGEFLALVRPDGITVEHEYAPEYPEQRGLVSYGFSSGGGIGYLTTPTPGTRVSSQWTGAPNSSKYSGAVADTQFSVDRGFYDTSFTVTITCDTPGADIYFTTDCSEPIDINGNPTPTALLYNESSNKPQITTTTCLRAAAIKSNWLPSNIDTQTYIFIEDVLDQTRPSDYPTSWSGYTADYELENDPTDIVLVAGDAAYTVEQARQVIKNALQTIPTLSVVTHRDSLFGGSGIYLNTTSRGINWERFCSAELFDPMEGSQFQLNCGLRLQGGASRNANKAPKHSLSLRFRGGYGPGKLNYNLFPGSPIKSFNSLQLRAMYNNSWIHWDSGQRSRGSMIRDQWVRDVLINMGDTSAGYGTYVHLYLNGLYWGVYNVHERAEASHHGEHYNLDPDTLDALNSGSAIDGSASSWNALHNLVSNAVSGGIDLSEYQQIQQKLDVVNLCDYMIVNHFGANSDWDGHNWRAAGGGVNDVPWRIYSWDAERVLEGITASKVGVNNSGKPSGLFQNLRNSAEFDILLADRIHKHFFNGGALTPEKAALTWMNRAAELDQAIIAESARWGDYRRDVHQYSNGPYELYTKNGFWLPEQNRLLNQYLTVSSGKNRSERVLEDQYTPNYYPSLDAPVFNINGSYQHGGYVSPGDSLTMDNPDNVGMIYYTTNSNDPRLPGGAVNTAGGATAYGSAIPISHSVHVKARVLNGGIWSALNEAVFVLPTVAQNLRITELMYHPPDGGGYNNEDFEFIELKHIGQPGEDPINLNLVSFTNGVEYTFDDSVELNPGEYVVVYKNEAAFNMRYPSFTGTKVGPYLGALNNGGEEIDLEDALGAKIHNFDYNDGWYEITDGLGFSLTVRDSYSTDPNDWDEKDGWRASFANGGSPGTDDSSFVLDDDAVIVNELLAHSDMEPTDWIEFYNTTEGPIDIGGWFISDDDTDLMKYEIEENYILPSHGYAVFYADPNFGPGSADPGSLSGFALTENGEKVYLTSGSGGALTGVYSTERRFYASEPDVAFGHYVKSTGTDFVAMSSNTPGWENAYPKVGPVVINEIAYNPNSNGDAEFVEFLNVSGGPITLYDSVKLTPWRFVDDWEDATPTLEYFFPAPPSVITLADGEYFLLVKDKTAFETVFLGGSDISTLGVQWRQWGAGSLNNGGEQPELQKPGDPGYYIRVDRIKYSDGSHPVGDDLWPTEPDDSDTYTLQRKVATDYGNDVINWDWNPYPLSTPGTANPVP